MDTEAAHQAQDTLNAVAGYREKFRETKLNRDSGFNETTGVSH